MEIIMIGETLELIRSELNNFIISKVGAGGGQDRVTLTSFVDGNGAIAIPDDSIGLCLLNIEEEKHLKTVGMVQKQRSEITSQMVRPPININLHIMFAAYFNQYQESLKYISYIMSFFQSKPVFDIENTPAMSNLDTKRLIFELNSINLEQLHYIWSMVGTRYLPSSIFKVRMLTLHEKDKVTEVANIQSIGTQVNKKEVND